jgi:hypothetical protein
MAAIGYAEPASIFAWLFAGSIVQVTILNFGIFTLLFGFNGAFRHNHVQFRYPRWLEQWLQSPAMHHAHHVPTGTGRVHALGPGAGATIRMQEFPAERERAVSRLVPDAARAERRSGPE